MDKKTKMLLGLGAVAVIGYLVYQNNKPKNMANLLSDYGCPKGWTLSKDLKKCVPKGSNF
jgi:hypothetical protein